MKNLVKIINNHNRKMKELLEELNEEIQKEVNLKVDVEPLIDTDDEIRKRKEKIKELKKEQSNLYDWMEFNFLHNRYLLSEEEYSDNIITLKKSIKEIDNEIKKTNKEIELFIDLAKELEE